MEENDSVKKALTHCKKYHKNQFRKNHEPYSGHPIEVLNILKKYGYDDHTTQSIALLHDVIEDSKITTDDLERDFNFEISNGVFVLSRNTITEKSKKLFEEIFGNGYENLVDEMYKIRLILARKMVRRIKIADTIHNTRDLKNLKKHAQEKKINDSINFYIPLGRKVAPEMVKELEENIRKFLASQKN